MGPTPTIVPPCIRITSRDTGEQCLWVCDHADKRTCADLIAEHVPRQSTVLYPDAWQRDHGSHPSHAPVCHGVHEWARDADGDGGREVHRNSCEGAGAALRTYLWAFRGVHKQDLYHYVATDEAMRDAKRVTPQLIRRMCVGNLAAHTSYT